MTIRNPSTILTFVKEGRMANYDYDYRRRRDEREYDEEPYYRGYGGDDEEPYYRSYGERSRYGQGRGRYYGEAQRRGVRGRAYGEPYGAYDYGRYEYGGAREPYYQRGHEVEYREPYYRGGYGRSPEERGFF